MAAALLGSAAVAAPLNPTAAGSTEASAIDQVRLVCNEYGRCYRTRGPRYVQRYYGGDDDGYVVRRSYGYYGGPSYYDRGYTTTAARASVSASGPVAGDLGKARSRRGPFRAARDEHKTPLIKRPLLS